MKRALRVVLIVCAALVPAAPVCAQEPEKVVPLEGTQAFRQILDHFKFQPVTSFAALRKADAKDVLIVVLGSTLALDQMRPGELRDFVARGGALLVASEQADEGRLGEFGVSISSGSVVDQRANFLGNEECPVVQPATGKSHPIFQNISQVATNRPSHLLSNELARIAVFSEWAVGGFRRHSLTFAAAAAPAPAAGRVLVLAGYGQFTNSMMLRLDNENIRFAWNCLRWLQESEDGRKRTQALFIENGTIIKSFKGPLAITVPPLSLATVVNHMLHRLQEENFFNRLLHRLVPPEWIWRGVLIVATALLIFFGRRWLLRSRERAPTGLPLVDQSVAAMLDELPLLSRRHRAMIRSGNYYEAARALARHLFDLHVGPAAASAMPAVQMTGGWWRRRARLADLEWLWDLAYGATATPISAGRLGEVIRACEKCDRALRRGELLFDQAPARKDIQVAGM